MNRTTIDLWVGIFVALGLGAIVFLSLKVGNLVQFKSDEGYRLEAHFDNIGGLKVRAPVKSAGVVVGRVGQIKLDPKTYEAVAVLNIEPAYQFSKDTIASILTSGLLGEQYVSLEPGGDPAFLKNGDRVAKTQSAVVLEKLLSQFMFSKAAEAGGGGDKK
jgi:phospholipid/cholesterol/gamma-HCH transport system substrate-binding protein